MFCGDTLFGLTRRRGQTICVMDADRLHPMHLRMAWLWVSWRWANCVGWQCFFWSQVDCNCDVGWQVRLGPTTTASIVWTWTRQFWYQLNLINKMIFSLIFKAQPKLFGYLWISFMILSFDSKTSWARTSREMVKFDESLHSRISGYPSLDWDSDL